MTEFSEIMATDVSQLNMLQVVPDPFVRVQVWGIRRQLLQIEPNSSTLCQESLDCSIPMDWRSIPDHQHLALDVAQQVFQEARYIYPIESPLLPCHQQLSLLSYPADYCQMIPRQWYMQDRCLSKRRISAHHSGQQVEASFVYPHDSLPSCSRFFLRAGQRLVYQAAIAASSRWVARRSGFCGLQPICSRMRPT